MKKFLVISVAFALALTSCKRDLNLGNEPIKNQSDQVINLSAPGASLSKAANQGIRVNFFEVGDQIGVSAILAPESPSNSGTYVPDWATAPYFENVTAAYVSDNSASATAGTEKTTFGWGTDGSGGGHNMYYPSGDRYISLCAYYPFADVAEGVTYVPVDLSGATEDEKQPKLQISLLDDTATEDPALAAPYFAQPDILWYMSATAVNRLTPTNLLEFKHALAQLRFTVKLAKGATAKFFRKIVFKTVKTGTMNIATGNFTYEQTPNYTEAVYTIEMPVDPTSNPTYGLLPEDDEDPATDDALDVLNPSNKNDFNYPMVLPIPAESIKNGVLELHLADEINTPDSELGAPITVNLSGFANNFVAGEQNTISLKVTGTQIDIEANIAAWSTGNTTELVAE